MLRRYGVRDPSMHATRFPSHGEPGGSDDQRSPKPDRSTQKLPIDSRELFRGTRELRIRHEGEIYVLRVTRNGRLILNK